MTKYIVAPKRGRYSKIKADWRQMLVSVEGLKILSPLESKRLVVDGDEQAIDRARTVLDENFHIEALIQHRKTD